MSKLLVTLTVDEFETLMANAVARGVAQAHPDALEYMTLAQVAKLLAIDERTVTAYIKDRELPATKLGHEWRFATKEITQWMSDRRYKIKKAG